MAIRNIAIIGAATIASSASIAPGDLVVTEAYGGVSGADGTADWFEITNLGEESISTTGLFYDDESADNGDMVALSEMIITAGESVIFLISDSGAGDFNSFWGTTGVQVGYADGAGLKEGDTVNLYDGNEWFSSLVLADVDDAYFTTQFGGALSSLETGQFTSVGSAADGPLVGDPGTFVPAPGAIALLVLGGGIARRRR